MATVHSTEPAAESSQPSTKGPRCYDSLVSEIAILECVQATLSEWDLGGKPTGSNCRIGSAELVLRGAIERLNRLAGEVEDMELRADEVHS